MFSTVFFLIPILFVCSWFGQIWLDEERQIHDRKINSMERVVAHLESYRDTPNFLSDLLRQFSGKVFGSSDPKRTFRRYKAHLEKRFPGLFEYIFLDGQGNPVKDLCDRSPSNYVLRKFYQDIKPYYAGNLEAFKERWSIYGSLLGPMTRSFQPPIDHVGEASYRRERAFVFVTHPFPKGMMIIHINQPDDWEILALRDRAIAFNNKKNTMQVFLVNVEKPISEQVQKWGGRELEIRRVLKAFSVSPMSVMQIDENFWTYRLITPTVKLLEKM